MRSLTRVKDADQRARIWDEAVDHSGGQPTAKTISEIVADVLEEGDESSDSTPSKGQKIACTYEKLRVAATIAQDWECVRKLIAELGSHLKLT